MSPLAIWNGPFDARLPNGATLSVGQEYDVSDRDLQSAHWQAVDTPATPARLAPAIPKPSDSQEDAE